MTDSPSDRPTDETRTDEPPTHQLWAPWWLYLVVILPANWARAAALPLDDQPTVVVVVIAVGQAALLFALITALWRLTRTGGPRA